jgi:EmrB/QacA subfamily drug resistance transporter
MNQVTEAIAPTIPSTAWKILAATGLGMFLVGLDVSIVNVAFPSLRADFEGATTASLSWVLTAYSIVYAGLLIISGRVADRVGRRRIFTAGLGVFVVGSVAVALAPTVGVLVAMRGVQGIGAAMVTPSSMGLVLAAWPPQRRATAIALWGAVFAVAVAVGPSLGAVIIEGLSWRWAFLVNLPVGVGVLWWSRSVLVETERDLRAAPPDLVGAVLVTVATAGTTLGIVQGRHWGWTSLPVLGSFAIAGAVIVAFVHRTRTRPDPIVPVSLFRIGSFRTASLALFTFSLGFFAFFLSMVLFLTDVWGYSILKAGLAITGGPATVAVVANFGGRLADRLGHRAVIVPGALLHAAGVAWWLWRLGPEPNFATGWLPGLVLSGAGIGATLGILAAAGVSEVGPENFSVAGAVTQTGRQLGGAIGLAIMIAVLGEPDGLDPTLHAFDRVFIYIIAMSLAAAIIASRIRPVATVAVLRR